MITGINYLTPEKSNELIHSIKNIKHKLIVMIMLDTGLRVSEACNLKIKNFNFKKRVLVVESLKKRGKKVSRTIPISNRLYNCIADYIQQTKITDPEAYLFPHQKDPTRPIRRQGVNIMLDRFKQKHGGFANLHPHALRHTFATNLLANDAELIHIKEMLGHESYDTTLIYTHIPTEILRAKIDKSTAEKPTLWTRLRRLFIKEERKLINIQAKGPSFIVGRNEQVGRLNVLAEKGINTIIIGGIGTGKSELLNQIATDKKVLKIDDLTDFKNTLINALMYLFNYDKEAVFNLMFPQYSLDEAKIKLTKHSTISLAKQLIEITEKQEYIILIDNVDRITPRNVKILEVLKDHFTIITTAREIPLNKSSFLWNFETLKLENLSRSDSLELIHRLSYDLEVEDMALFRNHIFDQSAGNPRVIYELIERYRKEAFVSNEVVREVRHYGSLQEIDMSIVIVLVLGGLAILRYLAMETEESSLKVFGGAAMVLLILFRNVFRFSKRKMY